MLIIKLLFFLKQGLLHFLCCGICDELRNFLTGVAGLIIKNMYSESIKMCIAREGNAW